MIELLPRNQAPMAMTVEDLEIIWSRGNTRTSVEINRMRMGDRADAEQFYCLVDSAGSPPRA